MICAMITYMTTLPVADARAQLSKLIDQAASTHERFEITRNGHRTAVLLSADDYDAMQETIAVLSDTALLAAHRDGEVAIASGDYLDADQLAHAMRDAGRGPR
jgi:antitoxin YefM